MTILCIETSTSVCSAALWKDGAVVEQLISREGGNHAKLLPRYIEQLLMHRENPDKTPIKPRETIDALAISEGPGSYTGLRIGTSTAKGLCYGMNVPLIAIPTLEILCSAAKAQNPDINGRTLLLPMIDARRMEVYTAVYDTNLVPKTDVRAAIMDENAKEQLSDKEEVCYFGDGAAKCQTILDSPNYRFIPEIVPEAQYMGILAEQRLKQGEALPMDKIAYYEPFYLKEFVAAQSHVKGLL
ncbi:MAG: tRNA (adenosine(37)-N6)-threonylcarbamoyltransferase complex dimerization subunit type 1 TsaB [Paludibacteraceae bacterium]|nr:tRNA (adenosine(37)-N6)-threonylcarbamoyltransferase complex dimerization subunit type 1 TsaB [Paludibacteraceae bacterium]